MDTNHKRDSIVVSAFLGVGKRDYIKNAPSNIRILDADSPPFRWEYNENGSQKLDEKGKPVKKPDEEFKKMYGDYVKDNLGKYDVIFTSTHQEIRDALARNEIDFTLVYPKLELKAEYAKRYESMVSADIIPQGAATFVFNNWDKFTKECAEQTKCHHVQLESSERIDAVMEKLLDQQRQKNTNVNQSESDITDIDMEDLSNQKILKRQHPGDITEELSPKKNKMDVDKDEILLQSAAHPPSTKSNTFQSR